MLPAGCRSIRESLLDLALALEEGNPTLAMEEHLRSCPGCSRYRDGLRVAARLQTPDALYTPELRLRTLAAAERCLDRPSWLAPLLLPASTAALAVSSFAPVWLLTALVRPMLGSEWASWGFALLLSSSAGLTAAGLGLVVLIRQREAGSDPAVSGHFPLEVSRG
jgi:hypothetical protein